MERIYCSIHYDCKRLDHLRNMNPMSHWAEAAKVPGQVAEMQSSLAVGPFPMD